MAPGMLYQMVSPHELPVTHGTGKLLLTRVDSLVSGQFIRMGKPPFATFPATAKRLFSCVCSHVGLQMGTFKVCLAASWMAINVTSYFG
jgi:hypothetical protein